MTHRTTERVGSPARRPRPARRARRARRSLAVTMMAVGLIVGAFAAPSMAEDGITDAAADNALVAPAAANGVLDPSPPVGNGPGTDNGEGNDGPDIPVPVDDCEPPIKDAELLTPGCQPEAPPVECPDGDDNGPLPGCDPVIEIDCPTGTEDNGQGVCVPVKDDDGGVTLPPPPATDKPTKGDKPPVVAKPGKTKDKGRKPQSQANISEVPSGRTGSSSLTSLGGTLAVAEGSVPGSEPAAAVSSCSDSVICQAAPAATSTGTATEGLPDTGAAANSRQLLAVGLGLLLAGGLLLKPGRRGRHRLAGA